MPPDTTIMNRNWWPNYNHNAMEPEDHDEVDHSHVHGQPFWHAGPPLPGQEDLHGTDSDPRMSPFNTTQQLHLGTTAGAAQDPSHSRFPSLESSPFNMEDLANDPITKEQPAQDMKIKEEDDDDDEDDRKPAARDTSNVKQEGGESTRHAARQRHQGRRHSLSEDPLSATRELFNNSKEDARMLPYDVDSIHLPPLDHTTMPYPGHFHHHHARAPNMGSAYHQGTPPGPAAASATLGQQQQHAAVPAQMPYPAYFHHHSQFHHPHVHTNYRFGFGHTATGSSAFAYQGIGVDSSLNATPMTSDVTDVGVTDPKTDQSPPSSSEESKTKKRKGKDQKKKKKAATSRKSSRAAKAPRRGGSQYSQNDAALAAVAASYARAASSASTRSGERTSQIRSSPTMTEEAAAKTPRAKSALQTWYTRLGDLVAYKEEHGYVFLLAFVNSCGVDFPPPISTKVIALTRNAVFVLPYTQALQRAAKIRSQSR